MKKFATSLILLGLSTSVLSNDHQANYLGFNTFDMNPFTMIYDAPQISKRHTLNEGEWLPQLSLNISNTLHSENQGNESLFVDTETHLYALTLDRGLANGWQVGVKLPFIQHGGGSLDGFIDSFHGAVGFPEGLRPQVPNNQFALNYSVDGNSIVNISNEVSGIGDISLNAIKQFAPLSMGLSLALPTGDDAKLLGSGTTDISLWVNTAHDISEQWQHYGGVSITASLGDTVLTDNHDQFIWQAMYGINWRLHRRIALRLQAEFQNNSYDSDTRCLGHSSSLVSGGTLYFNHGYELDIAVTEDIDVNTSPDVVFHFNLRKQY